LIDKFSTIINDKMNHWSEEFKLLLKQRAREKSDTVINDNSLFIKYRILLLRTWILRLKALNILLWMIKS